MPQPGIRRRRVGDEPHLEEDQAGPADVVHVVPAEALEAIDTEGMTLPIGAAKAAEEVDLPGDTVLIRPTAGDVPSDDELDERDAAKTTRRKHTGPRPPAGARRRRRPSTPVQTPPPTDPVNPPDPVEPA